MSIAHYVATATHIAMDAAHIIADYALYDHRDKLDDILASVLDNMVLIPIVAQPTCSRSHPVFRGASIRIRRFGDLLRVARIPVGCTVLPNSGFELSKDAFWRAIDAEKTVWMFSCPVCLRPFIRGQIITFINKMWRATFGDLT